MKGEVLDIKLFGSKARGNFKEDSDIDVLVLLKKLL
jgi:predicted nucleotidyltransferase